MGLRAFFGILPPRLPHSRRADDGGTVPLPRQVVLYLDGAEPQDIAVLPGGAVTTGQDLAFDGRGPLVSTVTGRVAGIAPLVGAQGGAGVSVTVLTAAEEEFAPDLQPLNDLEAAAPADLRRALLRAGLPGLAALRADVRIATLVASALDEAPGCAVNGAALDGGADQVGDLAAGLRLWQRASGAAQVVLALPTGADRPAGLPADVRTVAIAPVYPHGLPELLAVRLGGWLCQETPAGAVGDTMVVGLADLLASVRCLREGRPYVEKTISCLGPADRRPRNVRVRVGTPATDVLRHLGLAPEAGGKLLLGSPLRGNACPDAERSILPEVRQLVLQAPAQVHRFQQQSCASCGRCSDVCPVGLDVQRLGRYVEYDRFDRCAELAVERCVDCGLCAYVCPAHRPLAQLMMHAKQTLWRSPEKRQAEVDTAGCNACGPTCPAIRLFDLSADPAAGGTKERS